jgi:predicted Zn finger-like uncharacterized protein
MKCPRCDQTRQPEELECSNCGVDFGIVAQKLERSPETTASKPSQEADSNAPAPSDKVDVNNKPAGSAAARNSAPVDDELKPCPKCGYHNERRAPECLRCGIIFDKYEVYLEKRRRAEEETNQTTDGLLDTESVQMAVEASRQSPLEVVYARTACPHCAQRYKIRTDQVGILTRCKKCSSIFKIDLLPTIEP